jgi:hypothetical protein
VPVTPATPQTATAACVPDSAARRRRGPRRAGGRPPRTARITSAPGRSPAGARTWTATAKGLPAVLAACMAAGCSPGLGPGPVPAARPATPAPSAPATVTTPGGAVPVQVIDAYNGMWRAYAAAARTAGYQPGPLSHYAAGDALMMLTRSLYDDARHGIVTRGAPVLSPQVTSISPAGAPDAAAVTDCASDSGWRQYTRAGAPAPGPPAGRHRIYARLRLFSPVWKVTYLVVEKAGTC